MSISAGHWFDESVVERVANADHTTIERLCPYGPIAFRALFVRTATANRMAVDQRNGELVVNLFCASSAVHDEVSWSNSDRALAIRKLGCSDKCPGLGTVSLKRVQLEDEPRVQSDVCVGEALEGGEYICPFEPSLHPWKPFVSGVCRRISDGSERLRVARIEDDRAVALEMPDHDIDSYVAVEGTGVFVVNRGDSSLAWPRTTPQSGVRGRHELVAIGEDRIVHTAALEQLSEYAVSLRGSERLGPDRMLLVADIRQRFHAEAGTIRVGLVTDEQIRPIAWVPLGKWESVAFDGDRYYGVRRSAAEGGGGGRATATVEEIAVNPLWPL